MFAVILPGRPCLTEIQTVSGPPTPKFALTFPAQPKFSHIVVFMLPGNTLPPEAAAAVYIQFPGSQEFRLLGAIANEKQSAIFKVNFPGTGGASDAMTEAEGAGNIGAPPTTAAAMETPGGMVNLGISIELAESVQAQLASLMQSSTAASTITAAAAPDALALARKPPSTKILAQRIIQNAFNFLSSFSGTMANGQEVIPLKAFQEWWQKFERRVENDPGFLERPHD